MNINEAYNKGLDDAESAAVVKFSNAILGNDDGPFNNPQMEDIRQQLLNYSPAVIAERDYEYIIRLIQDREIEVDNLSEVDKTIVDILLFCKKIIGKRSKSVIRVKFREFLTKLEVDLINKRVKL